jgi:hypothetical protein
MPLYRQMKGHITLDYLAPKYLLYLWNMQYKIVTRVQHELYNCHSLCVALIWVTGVTTLFSWALTHWPSLHRGIRGFPKLSNSWSCLSPTEGDCLVWCLLANNKGRFKNSLQFNLAIRSMVFWTRRSPLEGYCNLWSHLLRPLYDL